MKISNQQLIMLVATLRDTLKLHDGAGIFTFPYEVRQKMWSEIITQQSRRIVEIGENAAKEEE